MKLLNRTEPEEARGDAKATPSRLAIREIHGNLTVTGKTITAWFVLSPQRWSFTTDAQREQLIYSFARSLSALAGRRVHLRSTLRPYPAREWAEKLYNNHPNRLPHFADTIAAAQVALRKSTMSDKVVFLGVDLKTRGRFDRLRGSALAEIAKQRTQLARLTDIAAGPGMEGRPATTPEVEWLIHRSIRLGLPAPTLSADTESSWESEDMHAFTDGVDYSYSKRFASTVAITASYDGLTDPNTGEKITELTRHVAVLATGRMGAITIPQVSRDPWMQHTDMLSFPVEWASAFDVLAGPEAAKATERKRLLIRDQQKQYLLHGIEEPLDLNEKAELARVIEHETTEGDPVVAARCYGWHRIAVSADTEEECLRRVQEVMDTYQRQQVDIRHPKGIKDGAAQFPLLQEFIPGESVSTDAYQRRLPALYLAAGLPHASASVGDRRGFYMGYTTSHSRRAFMFDPWYAMEWQEKSGLIPVWGELGSGKSGITGALAAWSTDAGNVTTVVDPAARLQALCDMPRLRKHAKWLDLVEGMDGSLNTYAVVAEPNPAHYESEHKYEEARQLARMARKTLTIDTARQLLPAQVDRMERTPLVLHDAVRRVAPERTSSMWDVVEALRAIHRDKGDEHALALANFLHDMSEMPQARLFYPNTVRDEEEHTDTLLVLTMHGLELPDEDKPRESWTTAQQIAVPMLSLASYYGTRRVYNLDPNQRKMIALDEGGMLARWGSGQSLFTGLARNSRKWNTAAIVASQNPGDILGMNVDNFVSTVFGGRVESESNASDGLNMLRIKAGHGYEQVLASLSPQVALSDERKRRGARDFLVKDVMGQVEKVKLDWSHDPELLAALANGSVAIREEEAA